MSQQTLSDEVLRNRHNALAGFEYLLDDLCDCGRLFHHRGWSVGTSSNYSVVLSQDPIDLIVTASGKDKGRLDRLDFVRVGADGRPAFPGQPKSSAETMLHVMLAERLESIGCILHTHSIWGTLLSNHFFENQGIEISGFEMLKGLEGINTHETSVWLPIFENSQDIPRLAEEIKAFQQRHPGRISHGFLLRRHGLYTWGRDVFAARRHVEIIEFLLECIGRSTRLIAD